MPPPRNAQDVLRITKQLAHPRDRKVRQLEKRQARADRVSGQELKRKQEKERQLLRMIWFREQCIALGHTKKAIPRAWWLPLVRLFIGRNDAELASLKAMRNPPVGRIRVLEHMIEEEMGELRSSKGFEIPSLGSDDEVEILTEVWDCLLETSVVLEKDYVTMPASSKDEEDAGVVQRELAARLKPIDEVRAAAVSVLPRRAQRFTEQRRALLSPGGSREKAAAKVAMRKTSVKQLHADSGAEQRARVKETARRKQQSNLKKHRESALAMRRNAFSE